ncbi:MAG TPA: hypothetical protein H9822_09970 [Candidatus Yaniella excrementavium]|nr:hypothetical protein [Candidatus Yaniella excrementavium]
MSEQEQPSHRRKVADAILWIVAAMIATYAAMTLPLPYKVAAPVLAIAGVVAAIRLFRLAAKGEHTMLVWLAGTAGLVGAVFFGGVATSQIIMWGPTQSYEQCLSEALTDRALVTCEEQYSHSLWD